MHSGIGDGVPWARLPGWHLSWSGKATTAVSVPEPALIAWLGTLGKVDDPLFLHSDNGLVCTSRAYIRLVRSYGLKQGTDLPQTHLFVSCPALWPI